jgi:RNA 3'-terminal phosphate cyclase (ATP)
MLELDGGAGGGQLLRTALSLSAVTGRSFEMTAIRGDRPEPGLKPQHLAAVEAVAAVCDADTTGAERGSETLVFEPGPVQPGTYEVDIDTAGSLLLVFDALLPLGVALDAEEELVVHATGGTDVKWAPTADQYRRVKLPLVRRTGLDARAYVLRRGFYPVGGGRATLRVAPPDDGLDRLSLTDPGPVERLTVRSVAATDLFDARVAERGAAAAVERLRALVDCAVESDADYVESDCPGAVLSVRADLADSRAGFDALGEKGRPVEDVADAAVDDFVAFHATGDDGAVPAVDGHTADQLAVVLALAGGRLTTPRLTDHLRTNSDLVAAFGGDIELAAGEPAVVRCDEPLRPSR